MKNRILAALAVVVGLVAGAWARTVDVVAQAATSVTLDFGVTDGRSYRLFLAHGSADAGDDKHAWENFLELPAVGASETTRVCEVPAALRDGRYLRFFLLQTEGLQMAQEVRGVHSTGQQWVDTGHQPSNRTTVDFRFGDVAYVNSTAFFGQNWSGDRYLLNQQSNSFYFHSGGQKFNIAPTPGVDYRCVIDEDSRLYFTYGGQLTTIAISRNTTTGMMSIFGCNDGSHLATFRFDRMKIANKGVLQFDFIPAVNASGEAGVYDQLHDTFLKSKTATPLVAGEPWDDGRFGRVLGQSASVKFRRAVTVAARTADTVTLKFDNRDETNNELWVGWGATDGGASKDAWTNFELVTTVTPGMTTYEYVLPESLKAENTRFRFFLLKTAALPYTTELVSLKSTGSQYVRTGICPDLDTTVDFTFGDVSFVGSTVFLGQAWNGYSYLFNQQGSSMFMFHGMDGQNIGPVTAGRTYNFRTTADGGAILHDGTTWRGVIEPHMANPLSELTVFGCYSLTRGATFRFDALKIMQAGFTVRDYIPVNAGGKGALFDRITGELHGNLGTADFTKGKNANRMGWVLNATGTLVSESTAGEFPARVTLTEDTDWTDLLAQVPETTVVDLNGHTLRLTTSDKAEFKVLGKSGTLEVTVPEGATCSRSPEIVGGSVALVKRGAGTYVVTAPHTGLASFTIEEGLVEMNSPFAFRQNMPATVKAGAAFDVKGTPGACAVFTIAGEGPDGKGALRNTGAGLDVGVPQMGGLILADDALICAVGHYGLINTQSMTTTFEPNGHTLTVNYSNGVGLWFTNTRGTSAGTVRVLNGIPYFWNTGYEVQLPNVDFVLEGVQSIFRVPTSANSKKIVVRDVTLVSGASFEEGNNVTYLRNLNVYDDCKVPSTAVKWIYVSGTVTVSNETSDVTIYPPITNNGTYPKLVKQGKGTLTLANNHTDQRFDQGADIQGGTVVMSSTAGTRNPHVAISSQPAPVTIHAGGTLDMTACEQPVKLTQLAVEDGGAIRAVAANELLFPNGATFARPEPFTGAMKVFFNGTVTFALADLFAGADAPQLGDVITLLKAGSIGGPAQYKVTGCPYGFDLVKSEDTLAIRLTAHGSTAGAPQIKIFTLGGTLAYHTAVNGVACSFRGDLAEALTVEGGWNVKMTGWRHELCGASGLSQQNSAWSGFAAGTDLALKTSAKRAGVLEGLETHCMTAEEPDFTIFVCGETDVADGVAEDTIYANWTEAVSRIREALPMTTVLAATIPNASDTLNRRLAAWCATQDEIVSVDLAAIFTSATPTCAQYAAAAQALKTQLFALATSEGKKTPTAWTRPEVKLGAENNVPAAYRDGYTLVRVLEPGERVHYAQNIEGVPYAYAPSFARTGIAKVAYYVELVHKTTGALQALWMDMDAMGPNWADVSLPVTVAQQKQQAVSRLHVWSNSRAVTQVPADDDSVNGYIEFNCLNYSEAEKNLSGAIAEPWLDVKNYGFDDTFSTSGTSGHACFQIMRSFGGGTPAGEILFAFNRWGSTGDQSYAIGLGTFADYGNLGYNTTKALDRTFTFGDAGSDPGNISSPAFSLRRISFYLKYAGTPEIDRTAQVTATWQGADNGFDTAANWQNAGGTALTSLDGQVLRVAPGTDIAFTYKGWDPVSHATTTLLVDGRTTFADVGGLYLNSLDLGETGTLVYDPTKFTFRLRGAPNFAEGGQIALLNAEGRTAGRYLLMTWDGGFLPTDETLLTSLFDATSAAGANVRVWAENFPLGGGRLWLDLDAAATRDRVNILCVGDSITQGSDGTYGNWRTGLMKKLSAAGYEPIAKGYWTIQSHDICGATLPDDWTRHAGISGQRIVTTNGGAGTLDGIEATLDQAGDVDFVLVKLGTNDINSNGTTAEQLFPSWVKLVKKILAQKPHAKVIAGAVVDIANEEKNAQVIAFNALVRAATTDGTFPAGRVFFADLYTPCYRYNANGEYIEGSFYSATDLHPDWPGEDKMAEVYAAAVEAAIAGAEVGWTTDAVEPVTDTTRGLENNVPAADRAGFRLARAFDATHHATDNFTRSGLPYEDYSASTAAVSDLARVGYYIELKRKNGFGNDYRGLVRWMWVTMDAFGDRTIETVGVPLTGIYQGKASRLRVRTNVPGLANTADGAYDQGWIEFWPSSYTNGGSADPEAPSHGYGYDWNDTRSANMAGFGSMQVHRLTSGQTNPAEVLFAFNRWTVDDGTREIGFGNFANQTLGSIDWTFAGDPNRGMVEAMSVAAYEVARIEIWTVGMDESDAGTAQVEVTGYSVENGIVTVEGDLVDFGPGATEANVTLEWSTDPAFDPAATQQQDLGAFTQTGKITAQVPGLTAGTNWYFRFTSTNDRGKTGPSERSEAWDLSTAVWRPQTETDTWQSAAWQKNGTGEVQLFAAGVPVLFDGAEAVSPAVVEVNEAVKAARIVVAADRDYTLGGTGTVTAGTLVKKGAGTLTLDQGVLGATRDLEIEAGTVKVGENAVTGAVGANGGTITVKAGASFDVNYIDTASGAGRPRADITRNKTFVIAGEGPNGEGALTISNENDFWGSPLNEIILAGDATIGGNGRMDVRGNAKNSITGPDDATLTIANTSREGTMGLNVHGAISVGKLAIAEGAALTLEGTGNVLTIPEGIALSGYLGSWAATPTWNVGGGVVVVGTEAGFGNGNGTSYIGTPITVPEGTRATLKGGATVRYTDALVNDGEMAVTSGAHWLEGPTVSGTGSYSVSGGELMCRDVADWSNADVRLAMTGGLLWWGRYEDTGTYPKPKSLDATGITGGRLVFCSGDGATIPSAFAAATPADMYVLTQSKDNVVTMEPGDYRLSGKLTMSNANKPGHLRLGDGVNFTVANVYLGDDANNAHPSVLEVGPGATLTTENRLWVGHYPDLNQGQLLKVDGGTLNANGEGVRVGIDCYRSDVEVNDGTVNAVGIICRREFEDPALRTELFALNGGTLNLGANGITGFTRYLPFLELNNGRVNAAANFAVEQLRAVSFGDRTGGTVDFNLGDKTVNWQTGLRGAADVELKGQGTFKSGVSDRTRMRFQGVPTGRWTIANTGVNNLYGAAGFAGGLTLEKDVTANLNIAGDTLVECAFLPGGNFATPKLASGLPFAANDLTTMHVAGDQNDFTYSSFAWQGQFYCDTPGVWTFAGNYDDNESLEIDGKEVFSTANWQDVRQGKVELSVGWHDFRVAQYQGGGGWGASQPGWKDVMTLGFAKSAVDGTDASKFTKFDGANLKLRPSSGAQGANGLVNWSSVANYNADTWNTRTDLTTNGRFKLSQLHAYRLAVTPTIAGSTHQFDGYVYVSAEQAGFWGVYTSYDDRISLQIDGVDSGTAANANSQSYAIGYIGEGWHKFRLRVADNTGSWGPWSNLGFYCRITVNGTPYLFDETGFQFSTIEPLLAGVERAGLDGTVELKAGSRLQNDAAANCPIWGTLKGSGTLAGTFAFAGEANCYEVSGTGVRRDVETRITFDVTDAHALAGLKKVKAVFDRNPGCSFYDVGAACGAQPAEIAVEVVDAAGNDYSANFSAVVEKDRLLLKNAHPSGFSLFFR